MSLPNLIRRRICVKTTVEFGKTGVCNFKTDDEDKADRFLDDVQAKEDFEDDKAALEDDLCDDPDANFDIWQ